MPSKPARARVMFVGAAALALLPIVLESQQTPAPASDAHRQDLEIQKLQLEVDRLRSEPRVPWWVSSALPFLAGVASTMGALLVARRNLLGALDQSVHEQRIAAYPKLVAVAEPLAIYFPPTACAEPLGPRQCQDMGRAMSHWYFSRGGLLLSERSRPAYFLLARALTRASAADRLSAPVYPRDGQAISEESLRRYRRELAFPKRPDHKRVEQWTFGGNASPDASPAEAFRDYVFLQWLSSSLRTALADDLRSRRRPADETLFT